ncbi:hypothetical protein MRB53_013998 [Persea americana]|uniref:Uncharacterized protein n=1 Tax=Persea americana TaxID=3435 RepID=A0ACC2KA02_PERAE|nr:hypothetical protein MRB53_013998 [Persea americana]
MGRGMKSVSLVLFTLPFFLLRKLKERQRLVIIALKHYSVCRQALGLPLEEPGRYVDANYFGNRYDPTNPLYRYNYWGEPKNSEKSR